MNICVFCASSDTVSEPFRVEARRVGVYIADEGHTLIYGGATGGLMDEVANTVRQNAGQIIGVVPELIVEKGRRSDLPDTLFEVESMHERKAMMQEMSDAFVVLPGGFGTLDELFDTVASGMVGYHDVPVLVVNTDNYFEGLRRQIERMQQEKIGYVGKNLLQFFDSADACIAHLRTIK